MPRCKAWSQQGKYSLANVLRPPDLASFAQPPAKVGLDVVPSMSPYYPRHKSSLFHTLCHVLRFDCSPQIPSLILSKRTRPTIKPRLTISRRHSISRIDSCSLASRMVSLRLDPADSGLEFHSSAVWPHLWSLFTVSHLPLQFSTLLLRRWLCNPRSRNHYVSLPPNIAIKGLSRSHNFMSR